MNLGETWDRTAQWVAGLLIVVYMMWQTYTGDGWVFPFSHADLGFHELGHMLTMFWAPRPVVSFAGSATQVAVPLGLGAYFWFRRKEFFATVVMLAWAASSLNNVSIYIFDATRRVLPLLGDPSGHDWAYLLGPQVLNVLQHTDAIAYTTRAASVLLFAGALAVIGYGLARPRLARREADQLAEHRATLPVREPRAEQVDPLETPPTPPATSDETTPPWMATP